MRTLRPRALGAALLCASLAACRVGAEHHEPELALPPAWSETASAEALSAGAAATGIAPEIEWWKSFEDPVLDSLIARAIPANLDLEGARARVREARAIRDVAAGGRMPRVDLGASAARTRLSENTPQGAFGERESSAYSLGVDASWEIDVFGRRAREVEAAEAGVEAADADRRAVLVGLLGEVARTYVELRGSQRRIALTHSNLDVQRDTLGLTRSRYQAGLASDLDVSRAEALLATTGAQLPSFESDERQAIHRLGLLLGTTPGALAAELEPVRPVPVAPERIALGIPSELVRRRPDVRRAERELAQATALSAAATADLFPRFSIGASYGQQSDSLKNLFDAASNTWSIGPALSVPIFNGGTLRAAVRVEDARAEQALVEYERGVLQALVEVEDALVAVGRERERLALLEQAVAADRRAVELAGELQRRGLIDFFQVLDAQRAQYLAESDLARSATALSTQTIALYMALGGGWELAEPDEVARVER